MPHSTFMPAIQTEAQLQQLQLEGLRWTVRHAYDNSTFYRTRLDDAGIAPGDIRTLDDIRKLPFTTADDLRAGYPFPLLSVPFEKVVRIHSSTGTTGTRKILSYTQKDIDDWISFFARAYEMAGVTESDRVQIAVGYGLWTAGAGFQLACEKIGAMAIPIGPGNIEMQCQFLIDLQPTVVCCTASMALLLAEQVAQRGLGNKINIKKVIYGSERSSVSMRKKISDLLGGVELFDIPGLTELYGPGTGMECPQHDCIHFWADYYILEILDPDTLQPLPDGEWGEMVVTTLRKEATPLIRYRTRDITRIIPGACTCGSVLPRHSRIKGRSDDMFIIRGVNVYPSSIDEILSNVEGLGSEYQIHLSRESTGKDLFKIIAERGEHSSPDLDGKLRNETKTRLKHQLQVTPDIEIVGYGTLPRSERKSRRVFDSRIQDSVV